MCCSDSLPALILRAEGSQVTQRERIPEVRSCGVSPWVLLVVGLC